MLTRNVVRAVQWAVRILTLGHVAVLLHEFAHALDHEDGAGDGAL